MSKLIFFPSSSFYSDLRFSLSTTYNDYDYIVHRFIIYCSFDSN